MIWSTGRKASSFRRQLWTSQRTTSFHGDVLHFDEIPQATAPGSPEQVASRLNSYVAAGARHLVCRIGTIDLTSQCEQLERIAELIPLIRHQR